MRRPDLPGDDKPVVAAEKGFSPAIYKRPENSRPRALLLYVALRCYFVVLTLAGVLPGAVPCLRGGTKVEYAGGTDRDLMPGVAGSLDLADEQYLGLYTGKRQIRIDYTRIDLLEYGQTVGRRLALAVVLSPAFLLSKTRKHFLTIGYRDEGGRQQALVFRVDKSGIRAMLVSLEARTGLKIQYQDEEARKAGRG